MQSNRFKNVGVIRLSRSQQTIKVYSDVHGYIGNALRNELLKLFCGEVDHVDIVMYEDRPTYLNGSFSLKLADPEKLKTSEELNSG